MPPLLSKPKPYNMKSLDRRTRREFLRALDKACQQNNITYLSVEKDFEWPCVILEEGLDIGTVKQFNKSLQDILPEGVGMFTTIANPKDEE